MAVYFNGSRILSGIFLCAAVLLSGCIETKGILQVVNDDTRPLEELYITSSAEMEWGNNLLTSPLENGWMYEATVAPGSWDIFIRDTGWQYRMQLGVEVSAGETRTLNVSSIPYYNPEEGESEGEVEPIEEGENEGEIAEMTTGPVDMNGVTTFSSSLPDGTHLYLPAVELPGHITRLTLSKGGETPDLGAPDLAPVGTPRTLEFDTFDPVAAGVPMARFVPSLTFPASEAEGYNPDTLFAIRVSDLIFGEQDLPGHVSYLPVNRKVTGDFEITDFYFPDAIISDLGQNTPGNKAVRYPRRITYALGTFEGCYDWDAASLLMRFYPDNTKAERRSSHDGLSEERQRTEEAKEIQNVVVLVHGHNEEEKAFGRNSDAPLPWYFGYKRNVWTPLYDYILREKAELLNCTAFYEFIYPSYKPIFTTSPDTRGARLDEDFAAHINSMIANHKAEYEEVRLYIVAHSMGGLVSRAGIQLFSTESHGAFQKLVTWGSPHLGTPLVTMRYVLGAPAGIYRAGPDGVVTFPLGSIDNTLYAIRRAVDGFQLDTPGTRDLRFANSHTTTPHNLSLDRLFSLDVDSTANPELQAKYDLFKGSEIYNTNLRLLNTNESYRLSEKYHALYGVTSKRARLELRWYYRPYIEGNMIALGAFAYPLVMADAKQPYEGYTQDSSDGAVNIASMAGAGVMGGRYCVGDIDHEEYYGAPSADGTFHMLQLARKTASDTLYFFNIQPCESKLLIDFLEPASGPIGSEIIIHGKGFGDDLYAYFYGTSGATIGGVDAPLLPFAPVTDTAITVTVPEFNTLAGNVIVRVGEVRSNAVPFTATLKTDMTITRIYGGGVVTGYFHASVISSFVAPLRYEWHVNDVLLSTDERLGNSGDEILLYDYESGEAAHIRLTVTDAVDRVGTEEYVHEPEK